jgi:hypothetical protein
MSPVYRAYYTHLDRLVALKLAAGAETAFYAGREIGFGAESSQYRQ